LERRLEKLFREEKEMLKERYNKSSHNNNLYDQREKSKGYFKLDVKVCLLRSRNS
jgi:hypothetical protein